MFSIPPYDVSAHNGADRLLLSALWSFVLITFLFANVNQLKLTPINGSEVSALFVENALVQLQIAMVVASIALKDRANFWANLAVATLSVGVLLHSATQNADSLMFTTIQIIGLIAILWVACVRVKIDHLLWLLAPPVK